MTPSELVDACAAAGITLRRDGDGLGIDAADQHVLDRWLPVLKAHKSVLLDEIDLRAEILRVSTAPTELFNRSELAALWALHSAWNHPFLDALDMTENAGRLEVAG